MYSRRYLLRLLEVLASKLGRDAVFFFFHSPPHTHTHTHTHTHAHTHTQVNSEKCLEVSHDSLHSILTRS
jgi:hypothetical protein